jgi:hypothetical protein
VGRASSFAALESEFAPLAIFSVRPQNVCLKEAFSFFEPVRGFAALEREFAPFAIFSVSRY